MSTFVFLFLVIVSTGGREGVGYGLYRDAAVCHKAFAIMQIDAKRKDITIHEVIAKCEPIEIISGRGV